jgi:hypothetical protein
MTILDPNYKPLDLSGCFKGVSKQRVLTLDLSPVEPITIPPQDFIAGIERPDLDKYYISKEEEVKEVAKQQQFKNKLFNEKDKYQRQLLFNHFLSIPNINQRKCADYFNITRTAFMNATGLIINEKLYMKQLRIYRNQTVNTVYDYSTRSD